MNDSMKTRNDLELTWEFEADVLEMNEDTGIPEYVKQIIHVPRMTTRRMIRYREALIENYGPILMAEDQAAKTTAIINEKMTPERMGEILVDMLCPELLDRLHPDSFDLLSEKIMEVEDKVLNPPEGQKKKAVKRKPGSGKGTRKR